MPQEHEAGGPRSDSDEEQPRKRAEPDAEADNGATREAIDHDPDSPGATIDSPEPAEPNEPG